MRVAAWAILVFVAVLAYVIAINLDQLTMAVVIGVIFGVLASVPASLFLLFTMRRAQGVRSGDLEVEKPRVVYIVMNEHAAKNLSAPLNGADVHVLTEVRR